MVYLSFFPAHRRRLCRGLSFGCLYRRRRAPLWV